MLSGGEIAGIVIGVIAALIIGIIIGFFIAKSVMKKQLKKNPPITKETIRSLYAKMGRKLTEQQINDIYNSSVKVK